jgi:serine/threonine protein phosphatase PrpC
MSSCIENFSGFLEEITITIGAVRIGRANEDYCAKYEFTIDEVKFTLILVLDGHGCPSRTGNIENKVVNLTAKYFPAIVYEYLSCKGITITNAEDAIVEAHLELQRHFNQVSKFEIYGSCTGGALIFNNTCVAFNLGDVVVLHLEANGEYRELSVAHNAKNPDERKRLEDLNVPISYDGRLYYENGGIMVSGALGDTGISFLTITPHLFTIELQQGDQIIVTSDGVIDGKNLSFERVIDIIKNSDNPSNISEEIVSNTIDFLRSKGMCFGMDDASAFVYSHIKIIEQISTFADEINEFDEKCMEKLQMLLEQFNEDVLRQIALSWLQSYQPSDDDESVWAGDALMAWQGDIDIDVIKYWGKPVEDLLSKQESSA